MNKVFEIIRIYTIGIYADEQTKTSDPILLFVGSILLLSFWLF